MYDKLFVMGAKKYISQDGADWLELHQRTEVKVIRRSPYGKRWAKLALEYISNVVAPDPHIFMNDIRVLLKIVGTMRDRNAVFVNQAGIAKELNMLPSTVNRSIRKLLDRGYIRRGKNMDKRYYELNPKLAWYGSDNGDHLTTLKGWDRNSPIQ